MSLVYGRKYSKTKMEFIFALTEKNLIKVIKEFAILHNRFASVVVVRTGIFVANLNSFINNICNTLANRK